MTKKIFLLILIFIISFSSVSCTMLMSPALQKRDFAYSQEDTTYYYVLNNLLLYIDKYNTSNDIDLFTALNMAILFTDEYISAMRSNSEPKMNIIFKENQIPRFVSIKKDGGTYFEFYLPKKLVESYDYNNGSPKMSMADGIIVCSYLIKGFTMDGYNSNIDTYMNIVNNNINKSVFDINQYLKYNTDNDYIKQRRESINSWRIVTLATDGIFSIFKNPRDIEKFDYFYKLRDAYNQGEENFVKYLEENYILGIDG